MEKQTTSVLETIQNWKRKIAAIAIGFILIIGAVEGQKLGDIRVDQVQVTEETAFILAHRAKMMGNYDDAERQLKALIDKYGDRGVYHFELAKLMQEIEEIDQAITEIKKAVAIEDGNEWYWEYLIELSAIAQNDHEAIDAYQRLYLLFPNRHGYLEHIAFHQLQNNDIQSSIKTLTQLESKQGVNFETTRKKHLIYDEIGETKSAGRELNLYLKEYPQDERMLLIAAAYARNNGNAKRAKKYYEQILKVNPNHSLAKTSLLKMDSQANSDYNQLRSFLSDRDIELDEKIYYFIPILTDFQNGKSPFQSVELEQAAQLLIDQYGEGDRVLALFGDIYAIQNRLDLAAEKYIASIKFSDTNYNVWKQLLTVLGEQKDVKQLAIYAEEAMDLYPNKPIPAAYFALSHAMHDDFTVADQYITIAKRICGKNENLKRAVHAISTQIEFMKGQ